MPADESPQSASKGICEFSKSVKRDMMCKVTDACSNDANSFAESVGGVIRFYNERVMFTDEGAICVLPIADDNKLPNRIRVPASWTGSRCE